MIEYESVRKVFADGSVAVENFSLVIPPRQTTVFVGSSGSGKTTLLRMINRMVDPTSGSVRIDGVDVGSSDAVQLRRGIGYVMQNGGLMPHLTVRDNVAAVPILRGVGRAQARAIADDKLATVGLDPSLSDRYPAQLSGGQQQRVGVARALSSDPNILLMDEPFAAVDPIVRAELQQETKRLQHDLDKTVVFVTHDIDEAFLLGDQVVILAAGGRIAQIGSPADIIEAPADDFVRRFVGLDGGRRSLRIRQTADGPILIDSAGRPQARLVEDAP